MRLLLHSQTSIAQPWSLGWINNIISRFNVLMLTFFMLGLSLIHVNEIGPWFVFPLQWRHNQRDDVSNHQPHNCLLKRLFSRRSKKTSKLRFCGLWEGYSPMTGEFSAQRASNPENVSIWWRHHVMVRAWIKNVMSPIIHSTFSTLESTVNNWNLRCL